MPNYYNETYMKGNIMHVLYHSSCLTVTCFFVEGLGNGQLNSLARSNASIYGNKEDLYDRLRRHAYQGKKGKVYFTKHLQSKMSNGLKNSFWISEKNGNDTTSDSDAQ